MVTEDDYTRSIDHPEAFWREQAHRIRWIREPEAIITRDDQGFYRWFAGGKLNTCYLALDWHVEQGRGWQPALIHDSPVTGTKRSYSFEELQRKVAIFAGVLTRLGVGKGDTVVIYMPMIPETIIGMLACARIGAIHSVVFGGFAPRELAIRIDDTKPKVLLAASAGKEVERVIDYLEIVDAALRDSNHKPSCCVIHQRDFHPAAIKSGRDVDWRRITESASPVDCVELDATDPLYILYTSGTTGRPKGIVRDNGGHAVALRFSMDAIYDTKPGDVFWAASDVGWVVGHSYIVYGPLLHGCTTVLYEGKPVRTPDAGAFWRVVAEHKVRTMFTAPTAIRAIKRDDPEGVLTKDYDIDSLRYLFLAGERCDVATLQWASRVLRVPVLDHWWQTETGWPIVANVAGPEPAAIKPGSAGRPVCGYDVRILSQQGEELPVNHQGAVAVRLPLPPGCLPNLWNNTQRFKDSYLAEYPGYYSSGDGGYKDEDGYVYITGRMDDIINVAGHRLATATMEEVVASHPAVAECAVIGVSDPLKGQVPVALVVLKSNITTEPGDLGQEIVHMVRERVGPVASLKQVAVTPRLPKTRSGKILRRTMRAIAEGEVVKVPSTIEDPTALDEVTTVMRSERLS